MTTTETRTLTSVAERVGCSLAHASRMRRGERLPSREMQWRIRDAYQLTPEQMGIWDMLIERHGAEGSAEFLGKLWD